MAQAFPSKLGRYQIVKHLANGGMAQVLLARATGIEGFERHVVVKRIHADRGEDPVFVKMFLDEARLAAQLHHNNIVQVHDIGKENGEYFFAMEYVHGEDLRKLLMRVNKKKDKVPFEHVVTIVTTVALALHHAHEQRGPDRKPLGLVHRDVSPANIIVGYDGNVKVVDFGIAKAALSSKREDTKAGALKGKVCYMAPEQCAGQQIDRRSDVYSLGIVLFELSTVRRLFKGKNDFLTMSAIVEGQIPKPSSYRADIPPELEAIIMKALALDPADRYQSADEMREALEQFAAAKGLRTSTGSLATYMKQVFGQRPEPWLVDDAPPAEELTVDFDGQEAGAAKPPQTAIEELEIPSLLSPTPTSPILRARKKAATDANALHKLTAPRAALPPPLSPRKTPVPGTLAPTPPPSPRKTPVPGTLPPPIPVKTKLDTPPKPVPVIDLVDGADDFVVAAKTDPSPLVPKDPIVPADSPTTASGTPLAWQSLPTAPRSMKWLAIVGGLVVAAAATAIFVISRGGGDGNEAVPPAKVAEPPLPVVEMPPPPPPAETPPVETPVVEPPPVEPPHIEVAAGSSAEPGVVKKKPPKKKKEQWNADELFLPEKKK